MAVAKLKLEEEEEKKHSRKRKKSRTELIAPHHSSLLWQSEILLFCSGDNYLFLTV